MQVIKKAVLLGAVIPLLGVLALLAPSASAATNVAARPASSPAAAPPAPDAPFPSCADQVTLRRLSKGGVQIRVVAVGFGSSQHKLWVTDTNSGDLYGPYFFNSSISRDILTNTDSPVTWAVEVTTDNNVTLCAADYYA